MQRRSGFTLVELMVAMALTIFVMTILSQAFVTGLDTFRQLKGIGDMQEGLRMAASRLRDDLQADHFEGKRRLSDSNFWSDGSPTLGFFFIRQGSLPQLTATVAPYRDEGVDRDGLRSYRAVDHILWFTVKMRSNRPEAFFRASLLSNSPLFSVATTQGPSNPDARHQPPLPTPPPNPPIPWPYCSQWAEIAYYLVQHGTTEDPENLGTAGTPLYSLYRAQRILVPDNTNLPQSAASFPLSQANLYSSMSYVVKGSGTSAYLYFPTPAETAQGSSNRSMTALLGPLPLNTAQLGSSLLLSNVVSFQVQVLKSTTSPPDFTDVGTFDSSIYSGYLVQALQITIRVWDPATAQTRQITIVQDT